MELTVENVRKIFRECFFDEEEEIVEPIIVSGCIMQVGFNPERIKKNEADIYDMLQQLPDDFKVSGGGGMSFINMCKNKEDKQWCDLHQTMDELVMLGMAIKKVKFLLPREFWVKLPGGMPYVIIS